MDFSFYHRMTRMKQTSNPFHPFHPMFFLFTTNFMNFTNCLFNSIHSMTPHHVRCFTHVFYTFISGKFEVSDWIRNHRITVKYP